MRRILLAAPGTLDLLEFERQAFIDEILERTRLLFGDIDPALNRYGIVDSSDPRTALPSDLNRSLVVSVSTVATSTIDVSPGTAVFSSGEIIVLSSGAAGVTVPGGIGTHSVAYLRFDELGRAPRLTRFDTLANTYVDFLATDADYVRVTTKEDYDALSVLERALTIPLAHIAVQEVLAPDGMTTIQELVLDLTRSLVADNRPWFTPVDIEHRSFVGTGVVSAVNPHGLSLNDISASSAQTIFQLHLDHGMIVSKDSDLAKVPGKVCEETIVEGAITVDVTGLVTGVMNSYVFSTQKFPTQLLRATDAATKTKDYAPIQLPRKNEIFLLPNDEYAGSGNIVIYYMTTDAIEPPTGVPLTSLVFKQPVELETVISGGIILSSIPNLELTFETASPIPQRFIVYLDGEGVFQRYPQTCMCFKKLSDLGASTLHTFDQALKGPAKLKVGLQSAVMGGTSSVIIHITGKDQVGTNISDDITFNSTVGWVNNPSGTCAEEPLQFLHTTNVYTSITNYMVTTNVDSGPNAAIAIFGDVTPEGTIELSDVLPVVEIMWDGLQICSLEDIRPINTTMHLPAVTKHSAGAMALAEMTLMYRPGVLFNYWVDDFNQPKFISTEFADVTGGGLAVTSTSMRKVFDGLDRFDTYVGRPVAVRPHAANPVSIRFTPIEPDRDFRLYARYYDGSNTWSTWLGFAHFVMPNYTLSVSDLALLGIFFVTPLVKWQVVVVGQCKGLITTYITDDIEPAGGSTALILDVGVWDGGAYT